MTAQTLSQVITSWSQPRIQSSTQSPRKRQRSSPAKHYGIYKAIKDVDDKAQPTIDEIFQRQFDIDSDKFNVLLAECLVSDDQPFTVVQSPFFKSLLSSLNPSVAVGMRTQTISNDNNNRSNLKKQQNLYLGKTILQSILLSLHTMAAEVCFNKLQQYYVKTDDSPISMVAYSLDPGLNIDYTDQNHWEMEFIQSYNMHTDDELQQEEQKSVWMKSTFTTVDLWNSAQTHGMSWNGGGLIKISLDIV
ncbi:hypothetical protein BCR42DRAFT_444129 [Absidia repens]|uniref:Uncharacterized protein n=1 Tax=Absidia repens TaxID=90262 RepID=A0A1X2HXG7_9FUNG|nr:hypothetical protein BCR42DRAFT_444129 [Absidia repens]